MTELVIYRGLPASGKTTLARHWVAKDPANRARVNRDDIREMFHAGVYLGDATEKHIRQARDRIIARLLDAGVSVASDDTNLANQVVRDLSSLAKGAGATVRIVDLTDVAVELCLARDYDRGQRGDRAVGEDVIRGMHERYLKGRPTPLPVPTIVSEVPELPDAYVAKPGTPLAIMVDLDGTLCLHNGRSPYDESRVGEDLPNRPVVEAVRAFRARSYAIIFCSGRSDACRQETTNWILEFGGVSRVGGIETPLFMRPAGDTRKDAIVKREIFDREIRDRYDVVFVLDDRNQVVDAWREIGLTVFQVAPGDF